MYIHTYIHTYTCVHTDTRGIHVYEEREREKRGREGKGQTECVRVGVLRLYMYIHLWIVHTYMDMFTCIHACVYMYTCVCVHVYMRVCTCTHACVYKYHPYMYMNIQTEPVCVRKCGCFEAVFASACLSVYGYLSVCVWLHCK